MKEQPNYFSIIPANVRYDKRLTPNAKLLYAEITALTQMNGLCFATNGYFAELYGVSIVSISKWIKQLIEYGYIESVIEYKEGTKEILHRYISLVKYPIKEKFNTPIKEKLKDNNTTIVDNNNTLIENNKIKPKKSFIVSDDWKPNEITINKLKEQGLNPDFIVEKFIYACQAKGLKYINHDKAILNWDWDRYKVKTSKVDKMRIVLRKNNFTEQAVNNMSDKDVADVFYLTHNDSELGE